MKRKGYHSMFEQYEMASHIFLLNSGLIQRASRSRRILQHNSAHPLFLVRETPCVSLFPTAQQSLYNIVNDTFQSRSFAFQSLETAATCLESLFQCLPTLLVKKYFPVASLNLLWCSPEPFPRVLSLHTRQKSKIY